MAVMALLLTAGVAFHYRQVLGRLIHIWHTNGDWSHGFIIPLFSLYYLYQRRDRMPWGVATGRWASVCLGGIVLIVAFALHLGSTQMRMEYPKTIALVLTVFGVALMVCGWPMTRWGWFAVAFLVFAMPLPQRLYEQLTIPLRQIAAQVSAAVLNLVPELEAEAVNKTVVNWTYQGRAGRLDVERACSGMRLMVTMMALGVAMAFIHERPLWQRMIMILACVPIAVFCNFVRVTTTGCLNVLGQSDLAGGTPHMLLGMGMLLVAFALYGGMSYVLNHLFEEADAGNGGEKSGLGGLPE